MPSTWEEFSTHVIKIGHTTGLWVKTTQSTCFHMVLHDAIEKCWWTGRDLVLLRGLHLCLPDDNDFSLFLTIGDFKVHWRRSSGRGSILFSDSDERISTTDAVPAIESVESSSLGTGPRYLSRTLYSYRHHVFFLLLR